MAAGIRTSPFATGLGGMLALASAMGIGRFVFTPILPSMAEALGLSKSQAGLIASANFAGYLAGALALTVAPNLPGRRQTWFLAALLTGAASVAGMAVAPGMAAFAVLRFISGVASAVVLVMSSTLVLDRLAQAPGGSRFSVLHFGGVGLGIAISAVLVAGLEAAGLDWRALWFWSGVLAALAVPAAAVLLRGDAAPPQSATAATSTARPPGLARLTLCHGLFGFGYVISATFLVAVVRSLPEARPIEPLVWLAVGLAAIPSTAAWSYAASRIGALPAYGLACALQAAGLAAGGIWPGASGALLSGILLGVTFMGITALGFAAARVLVPPAGQRRAFALISASFAAGQVAGPVLGGILLDRTGGFLWPSLVGAAALALAAVLAAGAARPAQG